MIRTIAFCSLLSAALFGQPQSSGRFKTPQGSAAQALLIVEQIAQSRRSGKIISENDLRSLRNQIKAATTHLSSHSPAGERLANALTSSQDKEASTAAVILKNAADDVHEMLMFKPLNEANLPKGFPTYTRVGTIEVKEYPVYRRAVSSNFGTLFRHITTNGIEMTAPVQMEMTEKPTGELSQQSMAFLYGAPEIGKQGKAGSVQVIDAQPMKVVSMGIRGSRNKTVMADAARRLKQWVKANPGYKTAGDFRVMGYNSPFVPRTKQYFEMQLPLEETPLEAPMPANAL